MHSPAWFVPAVVTPFVSAFAIWSLLAVREVQRRKGLKAVRAELARLGETAVSIEVVPAHTVADRAGLLGLHVFRVSARGGDGAVTTHLWAYEPGLIKAGGTPGLKRLSHGIWIPA